MLRAPRSLLVALLRRLAAGSGFAQAKPPLFPGNAQIAPIVFRQDGVAEGVAVDLTRALAARGT